ncbi:helix-turn-helix transcriptional regulator [Actinophytocola sp.]|uniref:helix-turn-helix domain-containing protein n=1 Tax=Actinophytocola sp. TaxID=1872138 RepID=UPI002D7F3D4E|nr:helix-turn-helix transcriptional regulator [Actinophytocola sp.]HET9139719.1 helix-turn-helix transcriptional regulator [Actinophytocola sp.]
MDSEDVEQPTAKRRQLAAQLRSARELAGVSGRDLAHRIGISQSKVSRIESGAKLPSLPDVQAWLRAVDAPAERRDLVVALTESVFTEVHDWQVALRARGHLQGQVEEREASARVVRNYQNSVVPGLLQTAEYARRVLGMAQVPYPPDNLAAAVHGRLQRQHAIYDASRRFEFLVTEAALRWRVGPAKLLIAQLDRIASLCTLENVVIGLIPLDAAATTTLTHGFTVYEPGDGEADPYVTVRTVHADIIVRGPDRVGLYQQRWDLLSGMAVFDEQARALLAGLAATLRGGAR